MRTGLAVFMLAGAASVASADVFYGVTNSASPQLLRFDMTAQTVTSVGAIPTVFEDCDFDASGTLWALRNGNIGGFPPTLVMQAYTINTTTAAATPQGNFGSNASLVSLAFHSSDSTFYSVDTAGANTSGKLVFANLAAGSIAAVTGNSDGLSPLRVDALAFSPSGNLYGIWNSNSSPFGSNSYKLVSFNPAGVASVIGPIISGTDAFNSLRFDSAGNAYTVDATNGGVYTVNLSTGAGTLAFNGGSLAMGTSGLGLLVPAPGAVALLGLGGLSLARRRR
jgi:hypothetical protein